MSFLPSAKASLLEVWRRIFPRAYVVPIEENADGQGFDAPSQQAVQFARASDAVNTTVGAYYIGPHSSQTAPPGSGAVRAQALLRIVRAAPANYDLTLIQGTQFIAQLKSPDDGHLIDQETYELITTYTIPAGTLYMDVLVQDVRVGYQGNTPLGTINIFATRGTATIQGTVLSGNRLSDNGVSDHITEAMIGQFVRFVAGANAGTYPRRVLSVTMGTAANIALLDGDPLIVGSAPNTELEEFADLGLTIVQQTAATGGKHGWLDASGQDRGVARATNESDASYRLRIQNLPDVVSPGAIYRTAARILTPLGLSFEIKETRDPNGLPGFIWDISPFDVGELYDGNVLFDEFDSVRFFIITVERGNQGEFGAPYDTPFPNNAWDVMFFDGYPVGFYAALAALYAAVEAARAAGVHWTIVIDPNL